jgi:hypothetical protein
VLALSPQRGDFNDDLQARSVNALRAALRPQLAPQDTERAGAAGRREREITDTVDPVLKS